MGISVMEAIRRGIVKRTEDTIIKIKPRQAALVMDEDCQPTFYLPHTDDDEAVSDGVVAMTVLAVVLSSEDLFVEALHRMDEMMKANAMVAEKTQTIQ